jgi:hypothetical protein
LLLPALLLLLQVVLLCPQLPLWLLHVLLRLLLQL